MPYQHSCDMTKGNTLDFDDILLIVQLKRATQQPRPSTWVHASMQTAGVVNQQKQRTHRAPPTPSLLLPPRSGVCGVHDAYLKSIHLPADIKVTVLCSLLLLHTDKAISNACQAGEKGVLTRQGG